MRNANSLVSRLITSILLAVTSLVSAHPGSGLAIDDQGVVYFTDTGKGLWKLNPGAKPELISPVSYHFLGMDRTGLFSNTRPSFGQWFARATPEGAVPTIIECSDFPMAFGRDGNLYYADTMPLTAKQPAPSRIMKRTPEGKETLLAEIVPEPPAPTTGGALRFITGLAGASDGSLYLVESAAQDEYVAIRKVAMDGTVTIAARAFVPDELKLDPRPSIAPSAVPANAPMPMLARTYCRGLFIAGDGTIYLAANACRAVLAIAPDKKVRIVLQSQAPWSPTDVAVHQNEVYALEYDHTGEDRKFWVPRIRKVDAQSNLQTLATITRD